MLEWAYWAADQIEELARSDLEYRQINSRRETLAPEFEKLLQRLSEGEKELILDYMMAEGDMAYRKTQIAYEFGKQIGRKQVQK